MVHLRDHEVTQDVRQIPGFPNYYITFSGEVLSENRDMMPLAQNINQFGIAHVGLYSDNRLYRRSVAKLVADAFLDPPQFSHYNTLIHLDGVKPNCHVENLMWRPRWFSFEYHKQYWEAPSPSWGKFPVEVPETNEWYDHCFDFCMSYGALVRHVIDALTFAKPVPLLWIDVRSPNFVGCM